MQIIQTTDSEILIVSVPADIKSYELHGFNKMNNLLITEHDDYQDNIRLHNDYKILGEVSKEGDVSFDCSPYVDVDSIKWSLYREKLMIGSFDDGMVGDEYLDKPNFISNERSCHTSSTVDKTPDYWLEKRTAILLTPEEIEYIKNKAKIEILTELELDDEFVDITGDDVRKYINKLSELLTIYKEELKQK